ncbi:Tubulin-specific chaperone A [Pitangus sulphuratus]|nr:Tubulin-specific chaperone A [Pitangus sulphuratus]
MADPRLRQIKIKTGVVRRVIPDKTRDCKITLKCHDNLYALLTIRVVDLLAIANDAAMGDDTADVCGLGLAKEKVMYEKEAKQQEEKIEKMKAEACDDYGIKKQIEILQESRMMIPDCQRRLEVAHAELSQLLENEKELEEAEEYKEARSILESVKLEA